MMRYRDTPWTLTARATPSGAHVWYYYWYDDAGRKGPKTTGIGYAKDKDKAKSRKQASDYCATLFRSGRLGANPYGTTLDGWVESTRFFDWYRSKWVRGILARSEDDKPGITETYVKAGAQTYRDHIAPHHGRIVIDEITPADCEDLLFAWKREAKNKTVNNWRSYYSTIMEEARRLGIIDANPWASVPQLKASSERRGGLTLAEGAKLLEEKPADGNELRYYTATKLAMMTGLRLSEVAGLLTDDVKSKTIDNVTMYYIDCTRQWSQSLKKRVPVKDKEARAVPITVALYDELAPFMTGAGRFLLSLRPDQSYPLPINRLGEWFNARVIEIGVDRDARNISFHSSRRFFNTLLRRRVSGDVLRKMTGHDSEEMSEHYTDYLPEDLAAISDAQASLTTPRDSAD